MPAPSGWKGHRGGETPILDLSSGALSSQGKHAAPPFLSAFPPPQHRSRRTFVTCTEQRIWFIALILVGVVKHKAAGQLPPQH